MNKKSNINRNQCGQNRGSHILLINFLVFGETGNDFDKANHQIYKEILQKE
jgi:hypothetical protein